MRSIRFRLLWLAGTLLAVPAVAATPARAAVKTFHAIADARVERAYPTTNYGRLRIEAARSPAIRTYVKFRVKGLQGHVRSARLRLWPQSRSAGYVVHRTGSHWLERTVTWYKAPPVGATLARSGRYGCCRGYVTTNVTGGVHGNGMVSLVITTKGRRAGYRAREWGSSSWPELVVRTTGHGSAPTPAQQSGSAPAFPFMDSGTPVQNAPVLGAGPSVYVSSSGSDGSAGTATAPWRTIAHALQAVPAGGAVHVAPGTYSEDVTLDRPGTTASSTLLWGQDARIRSLTIDAGHVGVRGMTISGASSDCVSIEPGLTTVTLESDTIRGCGGSGVRFVRSTSVAYTRDVLFDGLVVSVVGGSDSEADDLDVYADALTVQNCDLSGSPNDAVDLWGDSLVFRHDVIHDIHNGLGNHDDAFQTWTGYNDGAEGHPVTNLLLDANRIVNVTGSNSHGIMAEGPGHHDWTIRNNVWANIGSIGLILGVSPDGIAGARVYNNTFVNAGPGDSVEFNGAGSGVFADNVLSGGGDVWKGSAQTLSAGYNLYSSSAIGHPSGPGDQIADPGFMAPGSGDYHLAAGSHAIDAGDHATLINPDRASDLDGAPTIGNVDLGAYEKH